MRRAIASGLGFVLTSVATLVAVRWPEKRLLGWFELDGQPVAVDGQCVESWRQANEVLARSAAEVQLELEKYRDAATRPSEVLDREFTVDYVPDPATGRAERVLVRRFMPTRLLWGGNVHPIGYARYEVGGARPPKR